MDENHIVRREGNKAKQSAKLENLRSNDSFIEHIDARRERELFAKKNIDGLGKNKIDAVFARMNEQTGAVREEVDREYDKLWNSHHIDDVLMENSRRYDVSGDEAVAMNRELLKLASTDTHRPLKSRKKYVKKASAKYAHAARQMSSIRLDDHRWKAIEKGESAIKAVYEAEKSLIKAGGIYDRKEKLRIVRNSMKRDYMLIRFYKEHLNSIGLSEKTRRKLRSRFSKVTKELRKLKSQMVTETLSRVPKAEQLAGNSIMSGEQFLRYLGKLGKDNIKPSIRDIAEKLDQYRAMRGDRNEENLDALPLQEQITQLCNTMKAESPDKMKLVLALDIVLQQVNHAPVNNVELEEEEEEEPVNMLPGEELIDHREMLQNKKTNKELLKDDPYREYGYMSDFDFLKYSRNNVGFTDKRNKRLIMTSKDGTIGYLHTQNSSFINSYLRTKKVPDDVKDVRGWENNAKKTIKALKLATKDNTLEKKTRLTRMMNVDFFKNVLKIDSQLLNININDGDAVNKKKYEKIVNKAQKYIGTKITDKAFLSTGTKMDMPFKDRPVMMTLLCEEGQKCFVTSNKSETEVILPPGTEYTIVEIKSHGMQAKKIPTTHTEKLDQMVQDYKGIEVIVKVIPKDIPDETDELIIDLNKNGIKVIDVDKEDEKEDEKPEIIEIKKDEEKKEEQPQIIEEKKEEIEEKKEEIEEKPEIIEEKKEEEKKEEQPQVIEQKKEEIEEKPEIIEEKKEEEKKEEAPQIIEEKKEEEKPQIIEEKKEEENLNIINEEKINIIKEEPLSEKEKAKQNVLKAKKKMDEALKEYVKPLDDETIEKMLKDSQKDGNNGSGSNPTRVSPKNKDWHEEMDDFAQREYNDGTIYGNQTMQLVSEKGTDKEYTHEEFQQLWTDDEEFYVNDSNRTLYSAISRSDNKHTLTSLFVTNDLEYIENYKEQIENEFEQEIPGFKAYMDRRVELIKREAELEKAKDKGELKPMAGKLTDGLGNEISSEEVEKMGEQVYDITNCFELTGVPYAGKQKTVSGCYSVTMATQLQYMGVNISQQDVRLHRPGTRDEANATSSVKNQSGDVKELSEMVTRFTNNVGMHAVSYFSTERFGGSLNKLRRKIRGMAKNLGIEKLSKSVEDAIVKKAVERDPEYYGRGREQNLEYARRCIVDALAKYKTPVSVNTGGHYITIFGIEGTKVKYYEPMSPRKDGVKISDLNNLFSNEHFQIVWFEKLDAKADQKFAMTNDGEYKEGRFVTDPNAFILKDQSNRSAVPCLCENLKKERVMPMTKMDSGVEDNKKLVEENEIYDVQGGMIEQFYFPDRLKV